MRTLIVAETQARAKERFDELGLSEDDECGFIGYYGALYGQRYDLVCFIDWPRLSDKMWSWLSRDVLCRIAPNGEMVFR